MSEALQLFLTAAVPVAVAMLPGLALMSWRSARNSIEWGASVGAWSMVIGILLPTLSMASGFRAITAAGLLLFLCALGLLYRWWYRETLTTQHIALLATVFLLFGIFSLPFMVFHRGLPSGDSQKAILWAEKIMAEPGWPAYEQSVAWLNRDPADFRTPGLHAVTALVMSASPLPLTAIGFFSIMLVLVTVVIGVALALELFPEAPAFPLGLTTAFLVLTNVRFLRYLREPGYHYQNVFGELLLFSALWLGVRLLRRWNYRDALLVGLTMAALPLTHQFSAFLAPFVLAPLMIMWIIDRTYLKRPNQHLLHAYTLVVIVSAGIGSFLVLRYFLPHFFTGTPHLRELVPSLADYPRLMGATWLSLGLAGALLAAAISIRNSTKNILLIAVLLSTGILLALSQGPRLWIDIPPVRTLFYTVIPLSIFGSYFLISAVHALQASNVNKRSRAPVWIAYALVLAVGSTSVAQAFSLTHSSPTNSTLQFAHLALAENIQNSVGRGAILTDDFNERASSWLVLSGRPMFTRLASEILRPMLEAGQSNTRRNIYLNQLDFEKIFSLQSYAAVVERMQERNIQFISSQQNGGYGFAHNPALTIHSQAEGRVVYSAKLQQSPACDDNLEPSLRTWLLKITTIANDIGDYEDTQPDLPISLPTTRLSAPQLIGPCTYRSTSAPLIPVTINVGQYMAALWDQDRSGQADSALEVYVRILNQPSAPLLIETLPGTLLPLGADGLVHVPVPQTAYNDHGMLTLTIQNPSQQPLWLDVIAAGLAHTP